MTGIDIVILGLTLKFKQICIQFMCGDPHVKCNDECLEGGCECPECGHYDETPVPWGQSSSVSPLTKAPVGSPAAEKPQQRSDDESLSNGLVQTCHKRPADDTAVQSKRAKLKAELDEGTGLLLSAVRAQIKDGVSIKDGDAIMRVYGQTFPHKAALRQTFPLKQLLSLTELPQAGDPAVHVAVAAPAAQVAFVLQTDPVNNSQSTAALRKQLQTLSVGELKNALKARGLSSKGRGPDLLWRLLNVDST